MIYKIFATLWDNAFHVMLFFVKYLLRF